MNYKKIFYKTMSKNVKLMIHTIMKNKLINFKIDPTKIEYILF